MIDIVEHPLMPANTRVLVRPPNDAEPELFLPPWPWERRLTRMVLLVARGEAKRAQRWLRRTLARKGKRGRRNAQRIPVVMERTIGLRQEWQTVGRVG